MDAPAVTIQNTQRGRQAPSAANIVAGTQKGEHCPQCVAAAKAKISLPLPARAAALTDVAAASLPGRLIRKTRAVLQQG